MDAQPAEEFFSTNPEELRKIGETLPSQELLGGLMHGPRTHANYFNKTLLEWYPTGEHTNTEHSDEQQSARIVAGELQLYERVWLKNHLGPINDTYQSIVTSSPETMPQRSELSFHIINQFIMPQWHRILVSPKSPKMDTFDLQTAQIKLAIESVELATNQNDFEPTNLIENELRDIDTMIDLLQLSIDGELHDRPNIIVVPHPEMGREQCQADFIIFEPTPENTFSKKEIDSSDIRDPAQTPGVTAIELLNNLRINSLSRRPEFQDKTAFHKLVLAHRKARLSVQKNATQPTTPEENAL